MNQQLTIEKMKSMRLLGMARAQSEFVPPKLEKEEGKTLILG